MAPGNIFYRIAGQQNFVMVRNVDCERPLFSSKTAGKNAKEVSVRASLWAWRAKDKCLCREPLLSSDARATSVSRSWHPCSHVRSQSWVTLSRLLLLPHGRDCSRRRWCDNENETWNIIHGQVSWEPEMPAISLHACFRGLTLFQAISHWP